MKQLLHTRVVMYNTCWSRNVWNSGCRIEHQHKKVSIGNLSHSSNNAVLKHWMILRCDLRLAVALPRASQTCSIGLRSGGLLFQSIRRISSRSTNSLTRRALFGHVSSSIKLNSGETAPLKGEHRAPKPHSCTSQQSQYLSQRHEGVCGYTTWCLPRSSNFRHHK